MSSPPLRLSNISTPRQALVRLCQSLNYGQIRNLSVRNFEPSFQPPPTLVRDVKLDIEQSERSETALEDFALCVEIRRLLDLFDQTSLGCIHQIDVRAGIPRRVLIRASVTETPR